MDDLQALIDRTDSVTNIITTTTTEALDVVGAHTISAHCVVDVNTPAADTFEPSDVDASGDTITITGHGLTTGLKCQVSSATTLPAGLLVLTDYFVIVVDADTFKLASSLANALAGTEVDITDQGTGTHTITPTSIAGGAVKLQKSNNGSTWIDEGSATNITADDEIALEKVDPTFRYYRLHFALTAGRLSADCHILVKD